MYSADALFGYNIARVEANYFFDKQMPLAFQLNWHKPNYFSQSKLNTYGYSDFGLTFLYHDFRDEKLGKNLGLYAFMDFYFWKPKDGFQMSFRASQGVAYNTHPYDRITNSKNKFFGSHWLFPFDIAVYLKSPKIYNYCRIQAGFGVFHYSNGNLQSPNYGANLPSLTLGLLYDGRKEKTLDKQAVKDYNHKWQFAGFLRFGANESDYYDSGVYPFFIPGFQVEKHLNYRHKLIFGAELFLSYFLKEQIRYEYYAVPEKHIDKIYDFKRIGVYAEHEFYYKKLGINLGVGYYVYYPYAFESRIYNRLGTKYYINKHWAAMYSVKVHDINRAEAMEFSLMYRW